MKNGTINDVVRGYNMIATLAIALFLLCLRSGEEGQGEKEVHPKHDGRVKDDQPVKHGTETRKITLRLSG